MIFEIIHVGVLRASFLAPQENWKIYINILEGETILSFLPCSALYEWSARSLVGTYSILRLIVVRVRASESVTTVKLAKFSTYNISTCAIRAINAALTEVYSKRDRSTPVTSPRHFSLRKLNFTIVSCVI